VTYSKKKYLFNIIILVLSASMLNAFNKSIYLPTIPVYINGTDYLNDELKEKLNNHFAYKIVKEKNDRFYTFSIQNNKNKYRRAWLSETILYQTGVLLVGGVVEAITQAISTDDSEGTGFAIVAVYGGIGYLAFFLNSDYGFSRIVTSSYKIQYEEEDSYINKKQKLGGAFNTFIGDFSPLTSEKINWPIITGKQSILNSHTNYIELFKEIIKYNALSPNFNEINKWKKEALQLYGDPKGEFETSIKYQNRIDYETDMIQKINQEYKSKKEAIQFEFNQKKENKFDNLTKKIEKITPIVRLHPVKLSAYNADNQTFTITSTTHSLKKKINVKLKDAQSFKSKYSNSLVLKQKLKPIYSTYSSTSSEWKQEDEVVLINLKTKKQIPFLVPQELILEPAIIKEDSPFIYIIEE